MRGGIGRTVGVAVAALAALATIVVASLSNLNGDVWYALGCLETAGKGGVSIWDIFVSRPLAYKLLMAGLDAGRARLVGDSSLDTSHLVIRIETDVLVVAVTVVLYLGVRRVGGPLAAAGIAIATGLALIVAPPWHFLEPDWVAALAAALAVGVACLPRRPWLGALLAGPAAMLIVAVKLSTFPIALLALLVVGVFDRRRAAWATLSTVLCVALWYVLTKHYVPWEWTWLRDLANLVHEAPQGIRTGDLLRLRATVGDVAVLSPVVVLAPAAAAVLIRRCTGRRRWAGAGVAVAAIGMAVAPAYGQAEFYLYHFAAGVVLAAGVCGAAFALTPGFRLPLAVTAVLVTVASLVLLRQPADWRLANATPVIWAYEITAVVLAVPAWFLAGRTRLPLPWSAGVVVLCFALLPPVLQGAPYAFSAYDYNVHNGRSDNPALVELGKRLGADTPVLYLTYGTVNHDMGNPTTCRYPSPLWLQRSAALRVRTRPSYADNLRCLSDNRDARYVIVQNDWFNLKYLSPEVQSLVAERFDCSPAARIPAPPPFTVCPARG
ncbi:hypothetical protein ODJ79_27565 [Actinoplanes sp. KI2]|uniref:hypothetical protein n=1 Tax=Actinoplanes sp. KI2 TaxID=2983315 RepID=UPI0021D5CF61|nr:hypothetical protein [Actinoplanes sp. KI2]MCU7727495.1 hypothetical protein [Actinoplanes sp. KI2]